MKWGKKKMIDEYGRETGFYAFVKEAVIEDKKIAMLAKRLRVFI